MKFTVMLALAEDPKNVLTFWLDAENPETAEIAAVAEVNEVEAVPLEDIAIYAVITGHVSNLVGSY